MADLIYHESGEWYFAAQRCREGLGFVAWCAKTPMLGTGPLEVAFDKEVHFEFAPTAEAAIAALKLEVLT